MGLSFGVSERTSLTDSSSRCGGGDRGSGAWFDGGVFDLFLLIKQPILEDNVCVCVK